ncbi:hypothetical protein SELMODRAFT_122192 [Selaginella moellendorffii]|uniref:Thymidylate kinase n=1 Tax=Selaginella moellendorffii TaxID=88036 RepID=D8SQ47_SELML|nr:hypothetical protein SELMODRAFT_122192 [Selaginella moellendorffii]
MGAEKRGALIVLEGLDRSGKSSQCHRLVEFLKGTGLKVEAWRFPDRTTAIGSSISAYLGGGAELDDRAVHLLFSANRWEKRLQMERKLMAGTTLVVDRYSYSGVAFSAAKGLDLEWCKAPEVGLPAADLVLYLDISPEEAAVRGGYGDERYEQLDFQKKVALQYKGLQGKRWKIVDARQSFDQVHELMRETCVKTVSNCLNGCHHLSWLWTGRLTIAHCFITNSFFLHR